MRLATTHTNQTDRTRARAVRAPGPRRTVRQLPAGGLRPAGRPAGQRGRRRARLAHATARDQGIAATGRAHSRRRAREAASRARARNSPPTEGGRPTPTAGGRRGGEGGCLGAVAGRPVADGYAGGGSGCGCPRVLRPGDLVLVGEQHVGQQHALKGVVAKVAMPMESVSEVVAVLAIGSEVGDRRNAAVALAGRL